MNWPTVSVASAIGTRTSPTIAARERAGLEASRDRAIARDRPQEQLDQQGGEDVDAGADQERAGRVVNAERLFPRLTVEDFAALRGERFV